MAFIFANRGNRFFRGPQIKCLRDSLDWFPNSWKYLHEPAGTLLFYPSFYTVKKPYLQLRTYHFKLPQQIFNIPTFHRSLYDDL